MKNLLFLLLLLSSTIFSTAQAADILKVGTTGDYPPLTYLNPKTDQYEGLDIEIIQKLGDFLGKKIVFVQTSWPSLSTDLASGKFDIAVGGISITPTRSEKFLFTSPLLKDGKIALVRCTDKIKYATLQQINQPNARIIENAGGTNFEFAKQYLKNAKLTIVLNSQLPFQYLLQNKADVMITDKIEALYKQKTMPGLCAVNPNAPFTVDEKAYMLTKSNAKLLVSVNNFLVLLKKSGELAKSQAKWLN